MCLFDWCCSIGHHLLCIYEAASLPVLAKDSSRLSIQEKTLIHVYFDGWDGLGASAVLRAVAQRLVLKELGRPPELEFELVIHVDCSKWESTRRVQREIAEQLKLPSRVMQMFDKQDEEDDFDGKSDQGSRAEIADTTAEIQKSIQGRRFLLLLHNGSNEEIDISSLGLSLYGYLRNKMIWTFQGRFLIDPKMKDNIVAKSTTTDLLSASNHKQDQHELWSYLLREEATQVACKHGSDPAIVVECFLYTLELYCTVRHADTEYDLDTYWICDGLIQKLARGDDIGEEAWQDADALHGEMRLGMDCYRNTNKLPSHFVRYAESIPHWTSPAHAFVLVPHGVVPRRMPQHFDKLGVLKLSSCTFSFSSPPFLCCTVLRFLWLDHCQDLRSTDADKKEDAYGEEDTTRSWACFRSLWVLDLRYTDWDRILSAQVMDLMTQLRELNVMGAKNWDMSTIRGRLRNIRKLRVTKSTCSSDDSNVFSEMESMELLEFSENHITQGMACLSGPARSSRLKTVIIDGCDVLKTISLSGCRELKKLLLKGLLGSLEVLDLSGTSVKTLYLGEVLLGSLKWLILLGCEKLVAINPVSKRGSRPDVLRIDTTSTSASAQPAHPVHGDRSLQQQKEEKFNQWQISLADARLLRSLDVTIFRLFLSIHIDICPGGSCSVDQGTSRDKLALVQATSSTSSSSMVDSKYRDVLKEDGPVYYCSDSKMMMWDCPEIPSPSDSMTCIIKVITQGAAATSSALSLPPHICHKATSMHVYDNSCITSIPTPPRGLGWHYLMWCRVERCPKLHTLFATPSDRYQYLSDFGNLRTLWVSQLLTARYIWDDALHSSADSNKLAFLHLDYCPRLIHVLPLSMSMGGTTFQYLLETLEIVCCGDLREVFPFVPAGLQEQDALLAANTIVDFPSLRRIHLHELPMLHHIFPCTISAPNLETIKIRGCWSLKRLPAIGAKTQPPMVDCEKEWWDRLEWDGVEAYHHPSLYQPTHSLHYKDAQLPRRTLLR